MLPIFTNTNAHTVCLKSSNFNISFEKSRKNHPEEFWKKRYLKLANPQTVSINKYKFLGL